MPRHPDELGYPHQRRRLQLPRWRHPDMRWLVQLWIQVCVVLHCSFAGGQHLPLLSTAPCLSLLVLICRLILEASDDQDVTLTVPFLDDCWKDAAKGMPGYLETCAGTTDGVTYLNGGKTAQVSMIFDTQENVSGSACEEGQKLPLQRL